MTDRGHRANLDTRLRGAAGHVREPWTPDRIDQSWGGFVKRRRRRAVVRGAVTTAAVLCLLSVSSWAMFGRDRGPDEIARAPVAEPGVVRVDGAVARFEPDSARVALIADVPERAQVALVRGRARVEVDTRPPREFVVVSGRTTVAAHRSVFAIVRHDGGVELEVTDGEVRVRWPGGATVIGAGERFSISDTAQDDAPAVATPSPATGHAQADPIPAPDEVDELARQRQRIQDEPRDRRQHAHREPRRPAVRSAPRQDEADDEPASDDEPPAVQPAVDPVGALLEAADAARAAGEPRDAVRYLGRVVREHRRDPRAPLAAFTAGRVQLDDLDEPAAAAAAFAESRRLSPAGPLAEDALAREVESRARAGDRAGARELARLYEQRYPDGRRLGAVKRFGEGR